MVLCAVSTALVVAVALLFAGDLVDEGWTVAAVVIGAPLLLTVVARAGASRAPSARAALLVSLAAAASLVWAVVTVVGLGLCLLLPALVLCAAAVLLVVAAAEGARAPSS
ncbi:hypothetical protein [Pseudokineococcus sp. 5B2Z-1]|uniref:hypothetical protein n=1 Tax=Pseudokineococcus sp. 5B2Z-1 TaxID=3132744 RepID=UPI0030D99FD0